METTQDSGDTATRLAARPPAAGPDTAGEPVSPEQPDPGSVRRRRAGRTRPRAWHLVLSVDVACLLLPAAWVAQYRHAVVVMAVLSVLLFTAGERYRPRLHLSILDELPALLGRTLVAAAVVANVTAVRHNADGEGPERQLIEILRRPAVAGCDLMVVPRLRDVGSHPGPLDHVGAIPVVRVRNASLHGPGRHLKRVSDITLSAAGLVVFSPVLLLCMLAVRLEGGPGVFFVQQRVGRDGQHFSLIKFRSVRLPEHSESEPRWSIAGDERIGPVGRVLRRTSLDELPQLWNVLRGDMALVGPRPERPCFVEQFSTENPAYAGRHRVPTGLTGLAQVSGLRGDTSIPDRTRYDNYYIENWSLWLDAKVLLRTIHEVLAARGR